MQIAELICCYRCVTISNCKLSLWLISGLQRDHLESLLCLQQYELNIMSIDHRVSDLTDPDCYLSSINSNYGNMFLKCRICLVGNKLCHCLSAT